MTGPTRYFYIGVWRWVALWMGHCIQDYDFGHEYDNFV